MDVVVATDAAGVPAVSARLAAAGTVVTDVVAPGPTRRVVRAGAGDDGRAARVAADLRAEGLAAVARPAAGPRLAQWRRHTEPINVGDRLGVCFAWSEHERPAVDHLVELGAGGWGGHHPTTRLLLEELVARVGGGERVLDLGCGSGVLGLCALALGAGSVVALDVKEAALGATLANAAANGVADRVTVTTDPVGALAGTFDVVVANVGRAVLVDVGPDLASLVAAGGWLGASGFSPPQAGVVAARLAPLLESGRRTTADWCALVLRG